MLPIQPIEKDEHGRQRFRENKIVRFLLDAGPFDLNQLDRMDFPQKDREQFAQLIGSSLKAFGEHPYVSDEAFHAATKMADEGKTVEQAQIEYLQGVLEKTRAAVKEMAPHLFRIHPDDLQP